MSIHSNTTGGRNDSQPTEQQQTELEDLRRRLRNKYEYVRDEDQELFEEIDEYLQESATYYDGSVSSKVKSRLRELTREKKMRDHRGVENPEDAFPDDCEKCPHYGVMCPMTKRYSVTETIKRIFETAESDEEVVEELTDIAIENDCHVVLDVLDDCQGSYAEHLKKGYELNSRATKVIAGPSGDTDDGVTTTFDGGPSPEDEARMRDTIESVMKDEEGDDE